MINDFYELMKLKKDSSTGLDETIELVLASYGRSEDDPSLRDTDGMSLKEKEFRKCIDEEIFRPRRPAIEAMKQGIRLEGMLYC